MIDEFDLIVSFSFDWFGGAGGRKLRSSLFNWTNCERSFNDLLVISSFNFAFFCNEELVDDDEDEREWLFCWTTGDADVDEDDNDEFVFDEDFRCNISELWKARETGVCSSLVVVWLFVSSNVEDARVVSLAAASAAAAATKSDNCDGLSFSFKSKCWKEKNCLLFSYLIYLPGVLIVRSMLMHLVNIEKLEFVV